MAQQLVQRKPRPKDGAGCSGATSSRGLQEHLEPLSQHSSATAYPEHAAARLEVSALLSEA